MYKGSSLGLWINVAMAVFIRRDLEDIEKCDALIALLPRLSAETFMELFYAELMGRKTVCICPIENPCNGYYFIQT